MTARKTACRIARKNLQAVFSQVRTVGGSAARVGGPGARESPAGPGGGGAEPLRAGRPGTL